MVKIKVQLLWMFVVLLITSCGDSKVKLSPEAESAATAAKDGILGKVGEEIVRNSAGIEILEQQVIDSKKMAESSEKPSDKSVGQFTELLTKVEEVKKRWGERQKELFEELKEYEIPTVIAQDVPLKLVSPFKVKSLVTFVLLLQANVELTADRPAINDSHRHPVGYYKMSVLPLDNAGKPLIDEPVFVASDIDDAKYHDLKKGEDFAVKFELLTSHFSSPDYVTTKFLAAKRLQICWEHPKQEKTPDVTFGELGLFELRGLVQSCVWKGIYETNRLNFDIEGKWIRNNGSNPWANYPNVKRDNSGRIVKMDNGDESIEYAYNEKGLIVKRIINYMDGTDETKWIYNEDGDCVKNINSYEGMDAEDGDDNRVSTYVILERDSHNNWIKRKNQSGGIETRIITYYE